jgi:preprotein translocase subunit SecG
VGLVVVLLAVILIVMARGLTTLVQERQGKVVTAGLDTGAYSAQLCFVAPGAEEALRQLVNLAIWMLFLAFSRGAAARGQLGLTDYRMPVVAVEVLLDQP